MRISVVCAPQTFGCNTGMFSVDLAAWCFLKRRFPSAIPSFLTLYPHKCDFGQAPFRYSAECGEMSALRESDLIMYWGDFLHSLPYRNAVASRLLVLGVCSTPEEALERARKFLFLAEEDSALLERTLLYGGTLLFNRAESYADAVYVHDLEHLMGSARRVWVRDPFSALTVNLLRGGEQQSAHGTDCAQLLEQDFTRYFPGESDLPEAAKYKEAAGVFLGRSSFSAEKARDLILALQEVMGLEAIWLPWGGPPFFLDRQKDLLDCLPYTMKIAAGQEARPPWKTLAALQGFRLVISDTYHVCVNAWNFRIPAVCLIDDSSPALPVNAGSESGGRDKRLVFYWTYDAAPFLVYSSDLIDMCSVRAKAKEISILLSEAKIPGRIMAQMSEHTRVSSDLLAEELSG